LLFPGDPYLAVGAPIRAPRVSERVCISTESNGHGPSRDAAHSLFMGARPRRPPPARLRLAVFHRVWRCNSASRLMRPSRTPF